MAEEQPLKKNFKDKATGMDNLNETILLSFLHRSVINENTEFFYVVKILFDNSGFSSAAELFNDPIGQSSLLDLIAKYESGDNYNVVWGGQELDLTSMTINEVIAWQEKAKSEGVASTAAGRYQIINKTLEGLVEKRDLTGNEKFDEAMQDRLAMELLKGRGLEKFLNGDIPREDFMLNLSKEWAAFPKDESGLSYYHGDGLNVAGVHPQEVQFALNSLQITGTPKTLDSANAPEYDPQLSA